MLKQVIASFRLAHLSLALVGLTWVLPFLCPVHRLPITTFYQEWGAAVLGLCAMPLLVTRSYWLQPEIPRIAMLPLGLMLLALLQFAVGKMDYFSQTLLFSSYLLWAGLMVMLGQRLREELGLSLVATTMAAFLLLGAEVNTLFAIQQHFRWHSFMDRLVAWSPPGGAIFGSLGQPNHFASYVSMGLASLGLLHVRWNLRMWQTMFLALPMLFVLVLSGSRSPVLYLICFAGMAYFWQRRDQSGKPLLHYSLLLLVGLGMMNFVVQLPWFSGAHGDVTTMGRMIAGLESSADGEGVARSSVRLHIWYEAWLIFSNFPLLGAGFGQFGWQHFMLGSELHNPGITGLYNNAHNLVMQTAAEMGLAGLLVWGFTLIPWLRQMYRSPRTPYHWWGCGVLLVLGIHSLLEYPLWYAYFLGVPALMLGMLDGSTYRLELRNVGRISVAAILLLGGLSLAQAWRGYAMLEDLSYGRHLPKSNEEFVDRVMETHKQILLQPYVEVAISNMMEGRVQNLAIIRDLNESVMHFAPIASACYREVELLALSDESAAARVQLERSIWAHPVGYLVFIERLRELARKDPARFSGLLKFAQEKYEERNVAVRTK